MIMSLRNGRPLSREKTSLDSMDTTFPAMQRLVLCSPGHCHALTNGTFRKSQSADFEGLSVDQGAKGRAYSDGVLHDQLGKVVGVEGVEDVQPHNRKGVDVGVFGGHAGLAWLEIGHELGEDYRSGQSGRRGSAKRPWGK